MTVFVHIAKIVGSFGVVAWLFLTAFWGNYTTPQPLPPVPEEHKTTTSVQTKTQELLAILEETQEPSPQPQESGPKESTDTVAAETTIESSTEDPSLDTAPDPTPLHVLFQDVNDNARASIVNILCEMRSARSIKTITGSGVIIDPRGVVLTNAHIAQFFLVPDYPSKNATTCRLRAGNPAEDRYKAQVLYLPISWTYQHAEDIDVDAPLGTGEGDYALLYISESATEEALPATFPHVPVTTEERVVDTGDDVLIASYPALIAESQSIKNDLYLISTPTKVDQLFTFTADMLDLFALKGNIASHHGSSGGAVVNTEGKLVGLVVTSTGESFVLERKLRALTPAYISKEIQQENGTTLHELLNGNPSLRAKAFNVTTAPILTKLLTDALKN